jgi:hypothetical protein
MTAGVSTVAPCDNVLAVTTCALPTSFVEGSSAIATGLATGGFGGSTSTTGECGAAFARMKCGSEGCFDLYQSVYDAHTGSYIQKHQVFSSD